jgi:DinB superfamily
MHPRIHEVLEYLNTTRGELFNAVDAVPASRREEQPGADRWSVAEVLEHLNVIERRIARMLSASIAGAKVAGLGPELETSPVLDTIDRRRIGDRATAATAPEAVRPQAGLDAAAVWLAMQESRANLRSAVVAGDGLALSELKQEHPLFGLINLYQWVIFVGAHESRHAAQIREIASQFESHREPQNLN